MSPPAGGALGIAIGLGRVRAASVLTKATRPTIHEIKIAYRITGSNFREIVVAPRLRTGRLGLLRPFGFLTNHGLALLCIADDPEIRMRDIAAQVDITERAAQRIVADLIEAGYLDRERVGRRNRYTIQTGLPISLPAQRDVDLNSLLNVLLPNRSSAERRHAMPRTAKGAPLSTPPENMDGLRRGAS